MNKRQNKILAFILVLFTIFSILPVNVFAANTAKLYIKIYNEDKVMVNQIVKDATNNAMYNLTDVKTEISEAGYIVSGIYSTFEDKTFSNKINTNSVEVSGPTTVFVDVYKDDNNAVDDANIAYSFNIYCDDTKSVMTIGTSTYDLTDKIKEITKNGYIYEGAYGDSNYTEKIPDDTNVNLKQFTNIFLRVKSVRYNVISSSGLSKYTYTIAWKEGDTLADAEAKIKSCFSNGDKLAVVIYSDEARKAKMTDESFINDSKEAVVLVYAYAYFKETGPVSEKNYTISFDLNAPEGKAATGPAAFNAQKGYTAELETPKCDGYVFAGWFDGDKKVDMKYTVAKATKLTAHWNSATEDGNGTSEKVDLDGNPISAEEANSAVESTESKTESTAASETTSERSESVSTETTLKPIIPAWYEIVNQGKYKK